MPLPELQPTDEAPAAVLGDLLASECSVSLHMPCRSVHTLLASNPLLPGVIVLDSAGALQGLMSRQRFMEVFSQSYRSEVYFSRPLYKLLREEFAPPLCLACTTDIASAADAALRRTREHFNEPVAIAFPDGQYKVLEIRDLLHALATIQARQYSQLQMALRNLVQAEKLASLGSLVAGVAHEINTPIGVSLAAASHLVDQVSSFAAVVQRQQVRKTDLQSFMDNCSEASGIIFNNMERAAGLVRSFKQVAADQTSETRRSFDLHQTVGEILFNLRPSFKHRSVDLQAQVPEGIAMDGYPGALAQILSNLVLNSLIHGFDEDSVGTIQVVASELPGSKNIQLCIQDNGKGIAPPILGRIFDPFFTTRRNQGGTGLGLHIVYNLVHNTLGGSIQVDSPTGQGTLFELQIPRVSPYRKVAAASS